MTGKKSSLQLQNEHAEEACQGTEKFLFIMDEVWLLLVYSTFRTIQFYNFLFFKVPFFTRAKALDLAKQ